MWPHGEELWSHSWYRGRVETLDAKYNLILGSILLTASVATLSGAMVSFLVKR